MENKNIEKMKEEIKSVIFDMYSEVEASEIYERFCDDLDDLSFLVESTILSSYMSESVKNNWDTLSQEAKVSVYLTICHIVGAILLQAQSKDIPSILKNQIH